MQNLTLCKTKNFIPYTFINSNITVYSYEEAVYVFYENFTMHLKDIFSEKFYIWLNKIGIVANINSSDIEKINSFMTNSDLFTVAEIDAFKNQVLEFFEKEDYEQYKIIAYDCLKIGNTVNAIFYYKKSLASKETIDVLSNLGYIYKVVKDYKSAIKYLHKAIEKTADVVVVEELLDCYIKVNDLKNARSLLKVCNEVFSPDLFSFYIGELCGLEKDFVEQIYFYKEAYTLKNDKRYVIKIIDYYIDHRNFKEAENFLNSIDLVDIDVIIKNTEIIRNNDGAKKALLFLQEHNRAYMQNKKYLVALAKYKRLSYDIAGAELSINIAKNLFPNDREIMLEQAIIKKSKGLQKEYTNDIKLIVNDLVEQYRR